MINFLLKNQNSLRFGFFVFCTLTIGVMKTFEVRDKTDSNYFFVIPSLSRDLSTCSSLLSVFSLFTLNGKTKKLLPRRAKNGNTQTASGCHPVASASYTDARTFAKTSCRSRYTRCFICVALAGKPRHPEHSPPAFAMGWNPNDLRAVGFPRMVGDAPNKRLARRRSSSSLAELQPHKLRDTRPNRVAAIIGA